MKRDCKVCLVEHDEEIHAATMSIREWLRSRVLRSFNDDEALPEIQEVSTAA